MSLSLKHSEFLLSHPPLYRRTIPSRPNYRARKRCRLKSLTVQNQLNPTPPPFDELLRNLLSHLPSANSLSYLAPTLGLALLFSFRSSKSLPNPKPTGNFDAGEWILFTTPTPFNRFVTLRCPSIHFPGNEFLGDANETLVKEDKHYVKLNCGRMIHTAKSDWDGDGNMVYQRVCVAAEDGGVLSLDFPADLDLEEEHGLDNTVLIVPGTPEGSNERMIKIFTCDCLRRGFFPVVMNPRGCAGSPLITPRLFTAADSDDISTSVQYITKKRPWTTLMGVGWGYGANMLTKYLSESGDRTPLTAATCIDNPFDLEEAMRSTVYHTDFDQRHTDGLIKILQRNKEIFQGRGKGYDIEKALSATSTQEFERAISMVSYGFDTIEDFYEKSSTRDVVGRLKVPILFIQNDDGRVPLLSIPRSAIAENPYTSLLLCSNLPSNKIMDDTLTWCQNLTLEWLTAVELGLLKGRHPLLSTDVTINPSKGLELVEGRDSSKRARADMVLDITDGNSTKPPLNMINANDTATANQSQSVKDIGAPAFSTKGLQQVDNNLGRQSGAAVDAVVEEVASDDEIGQVLQTTQVVMNMVDMTMPDTLSDEQKKKVLNAVGRGETVIKALQDAVPEDVRGKLTTAVSGILQDQGSNLKLDRFISLGQIPDMGSGSNSISRPMETNDGGNVHSVDQEKTIGDPGDGSDKADHISDKSPGVMELENQSSETAQRSNDTDTSNTGRSSPDSERENMTIDDPGDGSDKPGNISESSPGVMELEKQSSESVQRPNDTDTSDLGRNSPDSEIANINVAKSSSEDEHLSGVGTSQSSDKEIVPEINGNQKDSIVVEGSGGADGIISDQNKVEREINNGELDLMEENNKQINDLSNDDQNKMSETFHAEVESSDPSPTSEARVIENEAESESSQVKEEKGPVSNPSQDTGDSPHFNVSQALNALTGFDDSTQVAVNNVFNVIEGMIDQLEVKEHENEVKNENNKSEANGVDELEVKEHENEVKNENNKSEANGVGEVKEKHNEQGENSSNSSDAKITKSELGAENEISMVPASGQFPAGDSLKCLSSSSENNKNIFIISSEDPLYREYLETYLYLKTRNDKPPDMYKKSALHHSGYISEGQCKVLEQIEANNASVDGHAIHVGSFREDRTKTQPISNDTDNIVEPSYVILDSDESQGQNDAVHNKELEEMVIVNDNTEFGYAEFENSKLFIKNLILKCLNNEFGRRASVSDMEELEPKLAVEIEFVADAVSMATGPAKLYMSNGNGNQSKEHGSLDGEIIIKAISSAFQDTQYLRRVLPVGVVVGSSLAELKKFFNVSTLIGNDEKHLALDQVDNSTKSLVQTGKQGKSDGLLRKTENEGDSSGLTSEEPDIIDLEVETSNNNRVMVGAALTAALGASALLAHQSNTGTDRILDEPMKEKENGKPSSNLDEMPDKAQNNMVTSLAEKAMSVAGPMVPMKEDGGVDQERLVSMLTELGQKGGLLRLVGKIGLLWGGIRGAMSLTDKLMSFLRIAERPLFQRIPGFLFLVLLLWSPVVLPFLPTLMQSWATHQPFQIAEFACIAGLYISVMIMVTLWGKKVRQYEDPILQYGLDLDSLPKFQNFLKGLIGGVSIVVLIHAVNSSLGCANLSWPITLSSSSSEPVALIKSYGRMLMLILQGVGTATGVSIVEESLFRSWLPQEIAADFGHYHGIIISGLLFSLFQRSAWEIPGLWLLSISLSGARERNSGNLSLPIGIRAGILAANFILKSGSFLTYRRNVPLWVSGGHQFQPFSGVVGFAFSLLLVVILYPRKTQNGNETSGVISESKTSDLEFQEN